MKLTKVTIHKYKSYNNDQSFNVDNNINVIVGTNETGKTTILEAIAKTNYYDSNDKNFKFNINSDYPIGEINNVQQNSSSIISCTYTLTKDEFEEIKQDIGDKCIDKDELIVSIKYNYSKDETNSIVIDITNNISIDEFLKFIISKDEFKLNQSDLEYILSLNTTTEILEAIKEQKNLNQSEEELNSNLLDVLNYIYNKYCYKDTLNWENWLIEYIYKKYILEKIPKFIFFDEYYEVPNKINLSTNETNSKNYLIFNNLLNLGGCSIEKLQNIQGGYSSLKPILENTSKKITEIISKYWINNPNLRIQIDIDTKNNDLNIRFYKDIHCTLPLSNQSKGFKWFFSFIVYFENIRKDKSEQYILLLDEPGLNLHPLAQRDLLKFFEDLSSNHQIIYTTHSPFMVDTKNLERTISVYKKSEDKIVITNDIEIKDKDTLIPLQTALGYVLSQNLFFNKNNLLVEGNSDVIFLSIMSSILKQSGKEELNENISIIPIGGAGKLAYFICLLQGQGLNLVCALDSFTQQTQKTQLEESIKKIDEKILSKIIYFENFTHKISDKKTGKKKSKKSNNTIKSMNLEDLFTNDDYLKLFSQAYPEIKIKEEDKEKIDNSKSIIDHINKIIKQKRFDHYKVAIEAKKLNLTKDYFSQKTLDNFEKLFKKINSMFDE